MHYKQDQELLLSIHTSPAFESPNTVEIKKHGIREEIQTLRAIAILSVLLFHLWHDIFSYGFLGVDIFFVISGYLMCRILSTKQPINTSIILTFYERRLKRIVPIYLTVISATLFSLYYLVSSIQFHQIDVETRPSLLFISNWPRATDTDYFDLKSKYDFLLHTWSLSVELQFYLFVPGIFLFFDLINLLTVRYSTLLRYSLLIMVICGSCLYQFCMKNNLNVQHMSLMARVWQFFCGFMAHYLYATITETNDKPLKSLKFIYILILSAILITLLFGIPFPILLLDKQVNRLFITLLTMFIISRPNYSHLLMSNKLLIILGDISYSIYLVHWPLITLFRYSNADKDQIEFSAGLFLLTCSILIGFCVEHLFKWLLKYLTDWSTLMAVILLGYCVSGFLMLRLEEHAIRLDGDNSLIVGNQSIYDMSAEFKFPSNFSLDSTNKDEMIKILKEYNTRLFQKQIGYTYCKNKTFELPTNYRLNWTAYNNTFKCIVEGSGHKNFVLIGNSHAGHNFEGVIEMFKDVYKTLVLDVHMSCLPTTLKYQQTVISESMKEECIHYLNDYFPSLQQWKEPIDVIIALFGLVGRPDVPIAGKIEDDEFFSSMQTFYQNLSRIPQEVLIIQKVGPIFKEISYQTLMSKLQSGKDYMNIGNTRGEILAEFPMFRKRMDVLNCTEKCIKMDFLNDLWCGQNETDFCSAIDVETGLLDFLDTNHPSPLGAIKHGRLMRQKYDEYLKRRNKG